MRHTTFRFGLNPTPIQERQVSRTQPRARNHAKAMRRLSREHIRIADTDEASP
jgi:hypothetical protein